MRRGTSDGTFRYRYFEIQNFNVVKPKVQHAVVVEIALLLRLNHTI